jgi:hypothetical protein
VQSGVPVAMASRTKPLLSVAGSLVVLALLPASAHAKELTSARACDPDGCRTITDRATLRGMEEGQPTTAPERAAPFHRIRMTVKVEGAEELAYTMVFVPSAGLLRFGSERDGYEWLAPTPRSLSGFKRLTRGLEPLPAATLRDAGEEPPQAKVHEVVLPPAAADDGGVPWAILLIPAGAALAIVGLRAAKPRTAPHRALPRDEAP